MTRGAPHLCVWSAAQWDAIERHARAERHCAQAALALVDRPSLASHWQQERAMHAAIVRAYANAVAPVGVPA